MDKRIAKAALTLALSLAAPLAMACEPEPGLQQNEVLQGDAEASCGGGGGGGSTPVYTLQGVIQNQGYESDGRPAGGKRLKIRAYSRFANANNDRVDANYINVRCNAYDQIGNGYTTDYDEEGNGALVDVHFKSNFVYGIYRKITVVCTHHAEYGANTYDATSNAEIEIPY
ncbi:hypothetical protein NB717_002363 [Xanthomonas sacchari]|uniref:Lipoprotein n=2 Tax=Xanthomonas TaxID=338 RepID=A0A6N7Q5F8_9XANT|nr:MULTISPECIES: hypothetical protein [Xanthomonas]MCW0385563.1 hypothetical protein [Xanthomonas sacchari]MCW0396794.1 hypothetical protein [Xanthomonas sacchari]MCW0400981.1 hypothetical protein [Xanthomonas sacchari]MCW0419987.1 hypothetical protein [Xanthomonas sacchari]MCW0423270.1 hypothetical protein [Xanthomonas sacchari]